MHPDPKLLKEVSHLPPPERIWHIIVAWPKKLDKRVPGYFWPKDANGHTIWDAQDLNPKGKP